MDNNIVKTKKQLVAEINKKIAGKSYSQVNRQSPPRDNITLRNMLKKELEEIANSYSIPLKLSNNKPKTKQQLIDDINIRLSKTSQVTLNTEATVFRPRKVYTPSSDSDSEIIRRTSPIYENRNIQYPNSTSSNFDLESLISDYESVKYPQSYREQRKRTPSPVYGRRNVQAPNSTSSNFDLESLISDYESVKYPR